MSVLTKGPLICIHLSTTSRFLSIRIGYELEMTSILVLIWYQFFSGEVQNYVALVQDSDEYGVH